MATKTARPMTFREAITPKNKPIKVPAQRTRPTPAPAPVQAPVDPHLELLRQIAFSTERTRQWVAFWSILTLTLAALGLAVLLLVLGPAINSL